VTIDDPFATSDEDTSDARSSGQHRVAADLAAVHRHRAHRPVSAPEDVTVAGGVGLNPLEAAAAPLLSLITRLKNTSTHPDPERCASG
jgi:type VI secretion system protein ImpK